ncbi:response regulator transcription factor [bacterium SCSIO 12741]|nr:response regulator transcription factor [bacterium SCSIO 12741]
MIQVVAIDDHQIMLDGLQAIFKPLADIELVHVVDRVDRAKRLNYSQIQVVILDIDLGEDNGMEFARYLLSTYPHLRILGFSMHEEREVISAFIQLGCHGYVNKMVSEDELIRAIRQVAAGQLLVGSKTVGSLADLFASASAHSQSPLSEREQEIVHLLVDDHSTKDVANRLFISPSTVETHRRNLMKKLGLKTLSGLTRYAIRMKWIQP